jgi:hypothetical protein
MEKTSDFNDFAALLYPQAREDELLAGAYTRSLFSST